MWATVSTGVGGQILNPNHHKDELSKLQNKLPIMD